LLSFLHNYGEDQIAAKALLGLLPEKGEEENIWQANLRSLIREWQDETNNTPQPIGRVEN
ncbi:MAG: hypothetical protein Q8R42_05270, partial [Desulfocapsaceae bacterium]|nr:hypothetical protein [Desulfocapsaceae bacterium]